MALPVLLVVLRVVRHGRCPRPGSMGLILAPNHQSWLDPMMVQYAAYPRRVTFLMTELFFDLPVVGLYFRASGARPIRAEGPSVAAMRAAREALAAGEIICLFPEGEITRTGQLGRGRRGIARLARSTGAPVLPLGIDGTMRVFSPLQRRPRRGRVDIRLGEAMPYTGGESREDEQAFTDRLMERLASLAYTPASLSSAESARSRRQRHCT